MNSTFSRLRKNSEKIALLVTLSWFALTTPTLADTLTTKNFRIDITRNCPQGSVTCDNVTYKGVDLKSGKSIQLTGRTLHSPGAGGVTPGRFLGYEFINGDYRYVVSDDGTLQIYQGKRLLQQETGTWQY